MDPILIPDEPEVGGGIFRMLEKLEEVTDSLLQRYGPFLLTHYLWLTGPAGQIRMNRNLIGHA